MDKQKFFNIIIIILAMIGGKLFSQYFITATHYKTFTSDKGGYSIVIPTEIEFSEENISIPFFGSTTIYKQNAYDYNLRFKFTVSHCTFPGNSIENINADKFLENMTADFLAWAKGTPLSNEKIEFRNNRGRECKIKTTDNKIIKMNFFIVKDKMYQLIAFCPRGESENKKIKNFFESFDLTKI